MSLLQDEGASASNSFTIERVIVAPLNVIPITCIRGSGICFRTVLTDHCPKLQDSWWVRMSGSWVVSSSRTGRLILSTFHASSSVMPRYPSAMAPLGH